MQRKAPAAVSRYMAEIGRRGGKSKRISAEARQANARRAALERWRRVRAQSEPPAPASKPIWEVAEELLARISPRELRRLPADGARHLDHYLYGTPKRTR